jgi:hypothetical protein
MPVHFTHDLGPESLITPYGPASAVCGQELREAHEIARPAPESDICPNCLSWSKRNKFQNYRCVVEMRPTGTHPADETTNAT